MNRLSIIIPAKDTKPEFLKEAVESIVKQNQGVFDVQVILVDDNSTSKETVDAYSQLKETYNVTILFNNRSPGVSGARNTGIKATSAQWVGFLDSDDWWSEKALYYFSRVLETYPEAHFIAGDTVMRHKGDSLHWNYDNARAEEFSNMLIEAHKRQGSLKLEPQLAVDLILRYSILFTGTLIVRRSVLESVGVFNENLARGEDVHLWLRIAKDNSLFFIPQPILNYRKHNQSETSDTPPGKGQQTFLPTFLNDTMWKPWNSAIRYRLSKSHSRSAWFFRGKKMWKDGIYHSAMAIKYRPFRLEYWKNFAGALIRRG